VKRLISNPRYDVGAGLVLVTLGFVVLHQAYEGRGRKMPVVLGPFLPW